MQLPKTRIISYFLLMVFASFFIMKGLHFHQDGCNYASHEKSSVVNSSSKCPICDFILSATVEPTVACLNFTLQTKSIQYFILPEQIFFTYICSFYLRGPPHMS